MSNMIERVAEAIAKEMGYRDPETVKFAARAAIAAMREPTEGGNEQPPFGSAYSGGRRVPKSMLSTPLGADRILKLLTTTL
jgi:hypothetical protein